MLRLTCCFVAAALSAAKRCTRPILRPAGVSDNPMDIQWRPVSEAGSASEARAYSTPESLADVQ